jgi:hypothetical protein
MGLQITIPLQITWIIEYVEKDTKEIKEGVILIGGLFLNRFIVSLILAHSQNLLVFKIV